MMSPVPDWLDRCVRDGAPIALPELLRLNVSRFHWDDLQVTLQDPPTSVPLIGQLTLKRHPGGLLLSGVLSGAVETPCSRCLKSFSQSVDLSIEEAFSLMASSQERSDRPVSGREVELLAGDFVEELDPDGVLDLQDVIRQLVETSLDSQSMCDVCLGLE